MDSHHTKILLPPGYSFLTGPSPLTRKLLPYQDACLRFLIEIYGIGGQFRPVNFRDPRPQRVSCYALFKGWLLLSQPPRCLRSRTPFTLYHLTDT